VKKSYVGWLAILGLAGVCLLAVAITPAWRHGDPIEDQLAKMERLQASEGPPLEPAQGKVSRNLPQALRLHVPVVAYFCQEWQTRQEAREHAAEVGEAADTPEEAAVVATMRKSRAEERIQRSVLTQLAADRNRVLAVVAITPDWGSASFLRAGVTASSPTTIIYSPEGREVWRYQGQVTREQIVKELAKMDLKPRAPGGSTSGRAPGDTRAAVIRRGAG